MPLRIVVRASAGVRTLQVQGRLTWDGLDELRSACGARPGAIELDLADLRAADAVGTAFLQGLVLAGARVRGANPYVEALLRAPERPVALPAAGEPSEGAGP